VNAISTAVEPYLPAAWTRTTSPSAWPPASLRKAAFLPTALLFSYAATLKTSDIDMRSAIKQSAEHLKNVAIAEGQKVASAGILYPNYSLADTPLATLYAENLPRLKALKKVVDPTDVMGLTGGFRF
jgi:hypothetical protein